MQRLTPKGSRVTLFLTICLLSSTLLSCQKANREIARELGTEFGKGAASEAGNKAMGAAIDRLKERSKPVIANPDKVIGDYYQLINQRRYESAWNTLTPEYQGKSNGYNKFMQWWGKVDSAIIIGTTLIQQNDSIAIVDVNLTYSMKDGSQANDSSRITLIVSPEGKWLIQDKL